MPEYHRDAKIHTSSFVSHINYWPIQRFLLRETKTKGYVYVSRYQKDSNSQARGEPNGRAPRSAWFVADGEGIFRQRCLSVPHTVIYILYIEAWQRRWQIRQPSAQSRLRSSAQGLLHLLCTYLWITNWSRLMYIATQKTHRFLCVATRYCSKMNCAPKVGHNVKQHG